MHTHTNGGVQGTSYTEDHCGIGNGRADGGFQSHSSPVPAAISIPPADILVLAVPVMQIGCV